MTASSRGTTYIQKNVVSEQSVAITITSTTTSTTATAATTTTTTTLHLFNDLFSRTTCVSWYQKPTINPDLYKITLFSQAFNIC